MFTHYLAGCLIFWLFGKVLNYPISASYLILGVIVGATPDITSLVFLFREHHKSGKWAHLHRDNITHTIFYPVITSLCMAGLSGINIAFIVFVALVSHLFLDLFGIGWGIKLFYPVSDKQFKLFHQKGKWIYTQEEIDAEVEKYGDPNWFRNLFLKPTVTAFIEWSSLFLTAGIIIWYFFKG